MTDNLQLQTSRLLDASSGSLIATSLADIENCLRVIFGITADTPVSAVSTITADGDVTLLGVLTLDDEPTTDLMCATKKYVDDNTGGSSGAVVKVKAIVTQTIAGGAEDFFEMRSTPEIEIGETDQYDYATDDTKLVCQDAGDYLIMGYIEYGPEASAYNPYDFKVRLMINGAEIMNAAIAQCNDDTIDTKRSFSVMYTLAEDDYIQLDILNHDTGTASIGGDSYMSMVKVA